MHEASGGRYGRAASGRRRPSLLEQTDRLVIASEPLVDQADQIVGIRLIVDGVRVGALLQRFVVPLTEIEQERQVLPRVGRHRIELQHAPRFRDRLIRPAKGREQISIVVMRGRIAWIELDRAVEFLFGDAPVELVQPQMAERGMRIGERVVEPQRLEHRAVRQREGVARQQVVVIELRQVDVGEARVRGGIVLMPLDRLLEAACRLAQSVARPRVPEVAALEIQLVGVRRNRPPRRDALFLGR